MAETAPVIRIDNLSKFYGRTRGVEGLSLEVSAGEIFGFLGPNGAGKTTTIRVVMGLLYPTGGKVFLFGEMVTRKAIQLRERVGYLPGEFTPYKDMTAISYLNYLASYRSRAAELRDWLFERLQFESELLTRKIKHLSHGNRQKLGIVAALEHRPELAMLDEPTLGLDPLVQERFYSLLKEMAAEGTTVFLSSHNLPEVEQVCRRVAIIRSGKLVVQKNISELKKQLRRRMLVRFKPGFQPTQGVIEGARFLSADGDYSVYEYSGEINILLAALASLPVADLLLPEPELEDVFRSYYQGDET